MRGFDRVARMRIPAEYWSKNELFFLKVTFKVTTETELSLKYPSSETHFTLLFYPPTQKALKSDLSKPEADLITGTINLILQIKYNNLK